MPNWTNLLMRARVRRYCFAATGFPSDSGDGGTKGENWDWCLCKCLVTGPRVHEGDNLCGTLLPYEGRDRAATKAPLRHDGSISSLPEISLRLSIEMHKYNPREGNVALHVEVIASVMTYLPSRMTSSESRVFFPWTSLSSTLSTQVRLCTR
jgi:hypothetical protein